MTDEYESLVRLHRAFLFVGVWWAAFGRFGIMGGAGGLPWRRRRWGNGGGTEAGTAKKVHGKGL